MPLTCILFSGSFILGNNVETALSGKFASKIVEKMKAKKYNPITLFVSKGIPIIGSDAVTHEIVFDKNAKLWYNKAEFIRMMVDIMKESPHHDGFPTWYEPIEEHCIRKMKHGPNQYKVAYNTKKGKYGSPQQVICFTITRYPSDLPLSNMVDQMKASLHTMYRLPSHQECAERFVSKFVDIAPGLVKHLKNIPPDDDIPQWVIDEFTIDTAKAMKDMTLKAPDVTYDCSLDRFFMDDSIKKILLRNNHKDLSHFSTTPLKQLLYQSGKLPNWKDMVYIVPPT